MPDIPKGTTHIWTPGYFKPNPAFTWISRRSCYKRVWGIWYSYTKWGEWVESSNDAKWFNDERRLGYLVTVNKFNKPGFTPVKEEL